MNTFSFLIPLFLEAIPFVQKPPVYVLKPELQAALRVLEKSQLPLDEFLVLNDLKSRWPLPPQDEYDDWLKSKPTQNSEHNLAVSLQVVKLFVKEESDDYFNDDLYLYYFVTDGLIPYGKVTSVYKNLDEGESFFFNEYDRLVFPLTGGAKSPTQHLIIDYGIVESDGDDIKDLQKLSIMVVDMAIAVYGAVDPQTTQVLAPLRKEVVALATLLISFQNDDRLVTSSFGFTNQEIDSLMTPATVYEFKRKHKKKSRFDSWEYDLMFRFLRI
jgi:hypothetical protein